MKAASGIVGLLLAAGVALGGDTVTSVNVVGYVKVTVPASRGLAFVGLNFESMATGGDGGMTALELFSTNQLVKNNINANADKIFAWKPGLGGAGGYLKLYQKLNGEFWTVGSPSVKTNPVFYSGSGIWIQSGNGAPQHTVTIMGNVPLDPQIDAARASGLNQIANPYPTDWDLNGTNVNWQTTPGVTANNVSANADKVYIWRGADYAKFYLRASDYKWHNMTGGSTNNAIIRVGEGAWYVAKKAFTNGFVRPYGIN
jgi:hypothetical protein